MLRIPNRQNLLPELYRTEFSVQKIPTSEQLRDAFRQRSVLFYNTFARSQS